MLKLKKILPIVCAAAVVFSGCGSDVKDAGSSEGLSADIQAETEINSDNDAVNNGDNMDNNEEGLNDGINEKQGDDSSADKQSGDNKASGAEDTSVKKETEKNSASSANNADKSSNSQTNITKPANSNMSSSNGNSSDGGSSTASKPAEQPAPAPAEPSYTYKDGTYSGSAQGFNGPVGVSVTISKDKITAVSVTSSTDDEPYISEAKALCSKIVSANSADVSAVSGATYSSNGIKGAVKAALAKAKN